MQQNNTISIVFGNFIIGPRQANLVLIAYASSEGSGEPAHPRSLARTFTLAHTSSESRGTFRQKARSLAPLNGWACAVKICRDGMLQDTNSFDGAQLPFLNLPCDGTYKFKLKQSSFWSFVNVPIRVRTSTVPLGRYEDKCFSLKYCCGQTDATLDAAWIFLQRVCGLVGGINLKLFRFSAA